MGLSNPNKIYDPIRQKWVVAHPEERVRQNVLQALIFRLGFPQNLIAVEKALDQMPHLSHISSKLPERRADLICFGKEIHPDYPLYPLLLVECKREKLSREALDQLLSYNHYLGAYFVALVGSSELYFCAKKAESFLSYIPSYKELIDAVRAHE